MLTPAEIVNVRRWMGYPRLIPGTLDWVYDSVHYNNLTDTLNGMPAEELAVLETVYLERLTTLETDIPDASDNLDTKVAGPYTANLNEINQRTALYNQWRNELCAFLGFEPGPGLAGDGSLHSIPIYRN